MSSAGTFRVCETGGPPLREALAEARALPSVLATMLRSLIEAWPDEVYSRPLVTTRFIMVIAGDLGIDVTVEGVETEQQAEMLRLRRCNSAQGFLYSPARPSGEVTGLIELIPQAVRQARRPTRNVA